MSEPIGSSIRPMSLSSPLSSDVPALSKRMQTQIDLFSQHLRSVLQDPTLASQNSFLQQVAENVSQLNQLVDQVMHLGGK